MSRPYGERSRKALLIACPVKTCAAIKGEHCVTARGERAASVHPSRVKLATGLKVRVRAASAIPEDTDLKVSADAVKLIDEVKAIENPYGLPLSPPITAVMGTSARLMKAIDEAYNLFYSHDTSASSDQVYDNILLAVQEYVEECKKR
jgi:hypothetical protein